MTRSQVCSKLLVAVVCLASGRRQSSFMSMTLETPKSCCCKAVTPGKEGAECPADKRTKNGGLRFFNSAQGTCCQLNSFLGCTLKMGYSFAKSESCVFHDRPAGNTTCCRALSWNGNGDPASFYVKQTRLRASAWNGDWNPTREVRISRDYIAGAKHHGSYVWPDEIINYLKSSGGEQWFCSRLEVTDKCEISVKSPNRCCCDKNNLWESKACLPGKPDWRGYILHDGAYWERSGDVIGAHQKCSDQPGTSYYSRRHSIGQCRRPGTLVWPHRFGESQCPDHELSQQNAIGIGCVCPFRDDGMFSSNLFEPTLECK